MADVVIIYRRMFDDNHVTIEDNLPTDKRRTGIVSWLRIEGVIDDVCVKQLRNIKSRDKRAQTVLNYVRACNNIETFEKFISIWRYVKKEEARDFESDLEKDLEGWGCKKYFTRPIKKFVPPNVDLPEANTPLDAIAPAESDVHDGINEFGLDSCFDASIYHEIFSEQRSKIEGSLQIDHVRTPDIIQRLLKAKVIDNYGVKLINLVSESHDDNPARSRAAHVLDYLLDHNKVATYKSFLNVWPTACSAPTTVDEFEAELKQRLDWSGISKPDGSNNRKASTVSGSVAAVAFHGTGSTPATTVTSSAVVNITTSSNTGSESLYSTCVNFPPTSSSEVSNSERQLVSEVTRTKKVTVTYEESITPQRLDPDATYRRVHEIVSPWVVKVEAWEEGSGTDANSTGTGFVFNDERNLLLTCRHVVFNNESDKPYKTIAITVRPNKNNNNLEENCYKPLCVGVEVVQDSKGADCDIAVLRVSNKNDTEKFKSWRTGSGKLRELSCALEKKKKELSSVYTYGCPAGYDFTACVGQISNYECRDDNDIEYIQFNNINIDKGSSGGPLCDMDGCVIGIVDYMDSDKAMRKFSKNIRGISENMTRAGRSLNEAGKNLSKNDSDHKHDAVSKNICEAGKNLCEASENLKIPVELTNKGFSFAVNSNEIIKFLSDISMIEYATVAKLT
jgi:S1-C subfamily serine protease